METKRCSKCGRELAVSEFYRAKNTKDGLFYMCKDCCRERDRLYSKTEKYKERKRIYNKTHKRVRKKYSEMTPEQKEKYRAKKRRQYERKNKEKIEAFKKLKEERKAKADAEREKKEELNRVRLANSCFNKVIFFIKKLRYVERVTNMYINKKREKDRIRKRIYRRKKKVEQNKSLSKQKAREYYMKNIEKITAYGREYYHSGAGRERGLLMRERMDDCYIRGQLVASGFPKEHITQDLIDFKRVHLKLKREIKRQEKALVESNNH